jgi:hypothetical protein
VSASAVFAIDCAEDGFYFAVFIQKYFKAGLSVCGLLPPLSAFAAPWAEVGDSMLRADIAVLASAGVVDDVTGQWPLPWAGILKQLESV